MNVVCCAKCRRPATLLCPCCQYSGQPTPYCSQACKEQDAIVHRSIRSTQIRGFPPKPSLILGIGLSEYADEPETSWVTVNHGPTGDLIDFARIMPYANFIKRLERSNHPSLSVFYPVTGPGHQHKDNRGLASLLGSNGPTIWKGPILLMRERPDSTPEIPRYCDTESSDLRILAKYLVYLTNNTRKAPLSLYGPQYHVQGGVLEVMVSCTLDLKVLHQEKYCYVRIPTTHDIFKDGHSMITGISDQMGLPLRISRIEPHRGWSDIADKIDRHNDNIEASAMAIDIDLNDPNGTFGKYPGDKPIGAVIVVRADQKPITVYQVEALAQWCIKIGEWEIGKLEAKFLGGIDSELDEATRQERHSQRKAIVDKWIGKECFERYLKYCIKTKGKDGESDNWKNVKSPYED